MVVENSDTGAVQNDGGAGPPSNGGAGPTEGGSGDATPTGTPDGGPAPPPAYTPNFKFKYAAAGESNKQVEGEFDDFLKSTVKDAETEEKLRKLYARSHGLDFVQAERDQYKPYAEKYESLVGNLQRVTGHAQRGDFQTFFESLKIPEEQILRYALERVQYHKLEPAQRAQLDEHRQATVRAQALELQNSQLMQGMQMTAARHREMELDTTLSRGDVAEVVQSFDARVGQPGAFKKLVIERGKYYAFDQGVDMPPEQVVADVFRMIGAQPSTGQQAFGGGAGGAGTSAQRPPVLPNVSGKGSSPVKKVYTSTDDLRKRAAELAASE